MTDIDILRRLADTAGIRTSFQDAWGKQAKVPEASLRALLGALGVAVDTDEAVRSSLAALESGGGGGQRRHGAQERPLLEPVYVIRAGIAPEVAVALPEQAAAENATAVGWTLGLEGGERREGRGESGDLRRAPVLTLPANLPLGYHRLTVSIGDVSASAQLIVVPHRCYLPEELNGPDRRVWALTTQLYALRSERNWGIGDFTDLALIATGAARREARALGLNPLHALFPAEPRHISPYSPSSRRFLNDLYIDVEAVPEFAECEAARAMVADPAFRGQLEAARAAPLVDHAAVAACKCPVLKTLWEHFRDRHLDADPDRALTDRGDAFRRFQREGGTALLQFAVFQALHEHFLREGAGFSWRDWPEPYRDPSSPEVGAFAAEHSDRVECFQYLQWEADRQLGDAARMGQAAGLSIGLYRDLAVGVDGNGAEAWADQELLVPGASVGAPPDLLNMKGQNWGLVPINPIALRRRAYEPFVAVLRANMRHAGALRIDHVMALTHLYWIPPGAEPSAGGYVEYPFEDMLGIVALESQRQRCLVVGEDLGTVPEGFRERMHDANVLSYRVLVFERRADGSFIPPNEYPSLATASVATHDIATLKGYWLGNDIGWRERLNLYPNDEARAADRQNRMRERRLLVDALVREGVLPPDAIDELLPADDSPVYTSALAEAVHRLLGHSNARLMLVQVEDAVGEAEQANLPGTVDEHPNWRRKLSITVEDLLKDEWFKQLTAALGDARQGR